MINQNAVYIGQEIHQLMEAQQKLFEAYKSIISKENQELRGQVEAYKENQQLLTSKLNSLNARMTSLDEDHYEILEILELLLTDIQG